MSPKNKAKLKKQRKDRAKQIFSKHNVDFLDSKKIQRYLVYWNRSKIIRIVTKAELRKICITVTRNNMSENLPYLTITIYDLDSNHHMFPILYDHELEIKVIIHDHND